MDIVYVYTKTKTDNELKYSLRSLKNLKEDIGNVWIVGDKPDWLTNVKHISFKDIGNDKQQNVILKLRRACNEEELSSDFIYMNDDFFFLEEQNLSSFDLGLLRGFEKIKRGSYANAIVNTIRILDLKNMKNPKNYEVHYPMIFNKEKFLSSIEFDDSHTYRSVYGNLNDVETITRKDFKAYDLKQFNVMKNDIFISLHSRLIDTKDILSFFENKFPEKCKYEM